jgi:hypothetical protein
MASIAELVLVAKTVAQSYMEFARVAKLAALDLGIRQARCSPA